MAPSTLDPRTPVIVAVGQVEQRPSDGQAGALEPTALLAEAARAAQADSGSDRLLAELDALAVIRIISWPYRDPAALVAGELGIAPARTIETDDGGNYPLYLLHRACREIQDGRADAVLVGGAEAWRSRAVLQHGGVLPWTLQGPDVAPTEVVRNPENLAHPGEWAREVMLPVEIYALFETAFRAARGWTLDEHRDRLAALWAGFSEVAAANPHAWIREPWTAERIRSPDDGNRFVGFPYTKVMNANASVEQAAAFVVCSVAKARDLGISSDRWVFPWAGAGAHEHWFVSNRWSLAEAPAVGVAGRTALDLAGLGIDDLAHVDLYSCFPSAVQIGARELGLGTDRPLTVTGGLAFAGGPWNDYVSHAIAAMVERLRADPGSTGLVWGNGGFLTKHEIGILSSEPPATPFRREDRQAEVDVLPRRELAEDGAVDGTLECAVVVHDRHGRPEKALASVLLADERRAWALTRDADAMATMLAGETAGAAAHVDADGLLRFT